jgi:pSer/pThr/pTyr-binding forkhead associated (FHA) protein
VLDHPHEHTIVLPKADPLQDSPGPADNVSIDLADIAPGTGVLVVRSGEREGERFVLRGDLADIGRHPDSAICLEDVTVSRRHAEISHVEGAYRVVDRGSLNGTYINQERVEAGELLHGDELQIGKFRMVFFDGR